MAKQTRIGIYGGFTPTALDTSAADKMRALAGFAQTVGDTTVAIGKPIIEAKRAEEGAQAAEEVRTVDPVTGEVSYGEINKMSAAKWGASQYNANLIRGVDASFKNDVRQNLTRISVESDGDVGKFDASVTGYMQGIQGAANIPPELRQSADTLVGAYRSNIIEQQTTTALANSKADVVLGRQTAKNDSFKFIADGNPAAAAVSMTEVITSITNDPDFTPKQKEYEIKEYQERVFVAGSRKELDTIVTQGDYVTGLDYIQKAIDNPPPGMDVAEREEYIATLTTDLSNSQKVADAKQAEMASQLKVTQSNNALNLTIDLLEGNISITEIKQAGRDNKISVSQLNTLENQFATTGKGSDSPETVDLINSLIQTDPESAATIIAQNAGSPTLSSGTASTMLKSIRASVEKGGILQTQESKMFSNHLKKNILNTNFGSYNKPMDIKRESEMQVVWAERVSNMQPGETIASITNELIMANKGVRVTKPIQADGYKSYSDATGPVSELTRQLMSGEITDAEYGLIATEMQSWFNYGLSYTDFREDYDLIMKGL